MLMIRLSHQYELRTTAVAAIVTSVCVVALVFPSRSAAQSPAERPADTLHFMQHGCSATAGVCNVSYRLDLKDGESFAIQIDGTESDNFVYDIAGFVIAVPPLRLARAGYDTTVLTQKHDKRYGGYLVTIRRKSGATSELPDATLLISVTTRTWSLAFGGGYSLSSLVDRVYALHDTIVANVGQKVVERERDHEDRVRPGTTTFIHAYASNWTNLAWTFGLGVGESGSATYLLGPSYRFDDKGAFTLGAVFGPQKDLPAGTRAGQITADPNAIGNLTSRTRIGAFIAISYSFLSSGESDFQKPVKGAESQSGGGGAGVATTPSSAPTGSVQTVTLKPDKISGIAPGASVSFTLTLADSTIFPGKKFAALQLSITADSATKALFSSVPPTVDLKVAADSKSAVGTFQAVVAPGASGSVAAKFTFAGGGMVVQPAAQVLSVKTP
jgi:hypothetical protein